MSTKIQDNQVYIIAFITFVVLIAVTLLSVVDSKARPQIVLQKQMKIEKMLKTIYPDMKEFTTQDGIFTVKGDSGTLGWAFTGKGKGYGGEIEMLVSLDKELAIKEAIILSHTETPGLGDVIVKQSFRDRFKGLKLNDVALRKNGGKVDAVTGATISSKAVTDGIRKIMTEKIEKISSQRN